MQMILSKDDLGELKFLLALIRQHEVTLQALTLKRDVFLAGLGVDVTQEEWELDDRGVITRKDASDGTDAA